jgi:DNA-binding MarR family transcriptional regulator
MTEKDSVDACVADFVEHYEIDPEVEGVVDRIGAIHKHLSRAFDETLAQHGLNLGEYKLLSRLVTRSATHTLSAGDLSRMLMLSSGAMTNRLDRLESAGLIERLRDPNDRRGVLVHITPSGRTLIDQAVKAQAEKECDVLSPLSNRDLTSLNKLLRTVLISLEREAHAAAS